jgi:hypothetical protein
MVKFYKSYQGNMKAGISTLVLLLCMAVSIQINAQTVVTPPADVILCVGGGYSTVGTISIAESNNGNFTSGTNLTYSISPPANFQFNTGATPTLTRTGSNNMSNLSVVVVKTDTLKIKFDLSGGSSGSIESFTITGLQVHAINTASTGNIERSGGTAVMNQNAVSDNKNHCTLASNPPASFFGLSSKYCSGALPDTLYGFPVDPSNNNPFSGAGITNLSGANKGKALFNPSSAGTGPHTITYAFCGTNYTASTSVSAKPTVTFPVPTVTTYDPRFGVVALQGNPIGGTFSGPGVSGSSFYPAIGVGSYKILYTYVDPVTFCSDTVSKTITVAIGSTGIPGLVNNYCVNNNTNIHLGLSFYPADLNGGGAVYIDEGFYLDGVLIPGNISTTGDTGTQYFNPSAAGAGPHTIAYKYFYIDFSTLEIGEYNWISTIVTVNPLPTPSFTLAASYCPTSSVFLLDGVPSYVPTSAGSGVFSGLNVVAATPSGPFTFDPSIAANNTARPITYTYTDSKGCSNSYTRNPIVYSSPAVSITTSISSTYCSDAPSFALAGSPVESFLNSSGSFSGSGVTATSQLNYLGPFFPYYTYNYSFDPSLALFGSDTIRYNYTDFNTGCSGSAYKAVVVNPKATATIGVIGKTKTFCAGQSVPLSTLLATVGGAAVPASCHWSAVGTGAGGSGGNGAFKDASNVNSTLFTAASIYIPSAIDIANGTVKLVLTTNSTLAPCTPGSDTAVIIIQALPGVSITQLGGAYCKTPGLVVPLKGLPAVLPSSSFSGPGVGGNFASGWTFSPIIAGAAGTKAITFTYTDPVTGCTNSASQNVVVNDVPVVSFTRNGSCENTNVLFKDFSTIATPDFIKKRVWDFSDNVVDTNTISNQNYTRTFSPAKNYVLKLIVTSNNGCVDTAKSSFDIGPYPVANFKWNKICSIDTVNFTDQSTIPVASTFVPSSVDSRHWDFGVTSLTNDTSALQNDTYHYTSVGSFNVKLKLTTNFGCADSITKRVFILPTVSPTPQNPYAIHFSDSTGYWDADGTNSSWVYNSTALLNKDSIVSGTNKIWTTGDSTYNINEQSYLNSPCYNMQYLDRPMIALKIWSATQQQIAGAVLQSSIDGGVTWKVEGKVGVGQNWYDYTSVIGNPGIQSVNQFAWTGQYGSWHLAKFGLERFELMTPAAKSSVRFRVVFGSSGNSLNLTDGFAVDSVWIGNKNKVVLLEHFTNFSTAACNTGNTKVNTLWNNRKNSLVEIQYHTSFPDFTDPMSQKNTPDPSARVLFYGLSQVPHSVLDGNYFSGNVYGPGAGLDTTDIDAKSLDNAKFNMGLQTFSGTDSLNAQVKIKANLQVTDAVVVHLAVIERVIGSLAPGPQGTSSQYEWVLKKMLPDAAGTYFPPTTWNVNDSAKVSYNWIYAPSDVYSPAQLGVVAFVQSASTKEIFQTIYAFGSDTVGGAPVSNGGGFVTGLSDPSGELKVHVYPNPSSEKSFVMFNKKVSQDFDWEVYDQLGKVMDHGRVRKGSEGFVLNTSSYASGMYVVKIGNGENVLYTKLLVVR